MSDTKLLNHKKNKESTEKVYRLALKKGAIDFACAIPKFGVKVFVNESDLESNTTLVETMLKVYCTSERNKAYEMYNIANSLFDIIRQTQSKNQTYQYILGFEFVQRGFETLGISNFTFQSNHIDYTFNYMGKMYDNIFDIEGAIYRKICDIYHKISDPAFTTFSSRYYWEEV